MNNETMNKIPDSKFQDGSTGFNGMPPCHSERSEESLAQTNEIPRRKKRSSE